MWLSRLERDIAGDEDATARLARQLVTTDRQAKAGMLAAVIAHDVGTPMNVIGMYAGMLTGGTINPTDIPGTGSTINEQIHKMTGSLTRLLEFARATRSEIEVVLLNDLVERARELVRPIAPRTKVVIEVAESRPPARVRVRPSLVEQVVVNLLLNAIEASPKGGAIDVTQKRTRGTDVDRLSSTSDYATLSITDQGDGAEDFDRVFDPFYGTKNPDRHAGLGLYACQQIASQHDGIVLAQAADTGGSIFSLLLPEETSR